MTFDYAETSLQQNTHGVRKTELCYISGDRLHVGIADPSSKDPNYRRKPLPYMVYMALFVIAFSVCYTIPLAQGLDKGSSQSFVQKPFGLTWFDSN